MGTRFMRSSRWAAVLAVCLAAALLAACGSSSADDEAALATATASSGPRTSSILKNKFEPMKVAVGSKVTWVNDDAVAHNVIGKDGAPFKSGTLDKGDTFTHEFASAGLFKYTCTFHPGMDGVIQVE